LEFLLLRRWVRLAFFTVLLQGWSRRVAVVDEHFESQRVVFVLSDAEPIVDEQESVGAPPIAVEQLVTLLITTAELCSHGEVHATVVVDAPPPLVVLGLVELHELFHGHVGLLAEFPEGGLLSSDSD